MIEIQCFNEAYQHYIQKKISFRLLQDQAFVIFGLCQTTHSSVSNALEVSQADINWLMQQPEAMQDYVGNLGGYVFVCEDEEDLLHIKGCDFEWASLHEGSWPNVTDLAMSWDACHYLDESHGEPQWVMFLLCWNNAGGPVYYLPQQLWTKARVTEHIKANNPTQNT